MAVQLRARALHAVAGLAASALTWVLAMAVGEGFAEIGALVAVSYVLLAIALRPVTAGLGFIGALLFWMLLASGAVAVLSQLGRTLPSPWNALWGVELYLLGVIGVIALIGAVVAFVTTARPWWAILLLALTPVLELGGLILLGPWPHAALVPVGALAAVLALAWRRPQHVHRAE